MAEIKKPLDKKTLIKSIVVFIFFIIIVSSTGKFNFELLINLAIFGFFFLFFRPSKHEKNLLNLLRQKPPKSSNPSGLEKATDLTTNSPAQIPAEMFNQVMNLLTEQSTVKNIDQTTVLETAAQSPAINPLASLVQSAWMAGSTNIHLSRKKKYLQVALNGTLDEAINTINNLPRSEKIIIEAGTPLIKIYGAQAVKTLRQYLPDAYIVADIKIADLAAREVEIFKQAGANAITALGVAPIETLNEFISACKAHNLDSMIDMMNVSSSISILKKLSALPDVVILHRGVDETESTKGKMIPYYQINQIKGNYNLIVAVAGGDTPKEIQSAVFNGANIVVVWKNFQNGGGIRALAENFLKEIR